MADNELVSKWLNKAEEDFRYAEISLREEIPFYA